MANLAQICLIPFRDKTSTVPPIMISRLAQRDSRVMMTKDILFLRKRLSVALLCTAALQSSWGAAPLMQSERATGLPPQELLGLLLRRQGDGLNQILSQSALTHTLLSLLLTSAVLTGFFGFILGRMGGWRQGFSTAVKLPMVYLASMAVTLPALFVLGVFFGLTLDLPSTATLMLATLALNALFLACFAPVLGLVSISSDYHTTKLLATLLGGISALLSCVLPGQVLGQHVTSGSSFILFLAWAALYAFCGTQCAWLLRPFLGEPGLPFQWFRTNTKRMTFLGAVWVSIQARLPKLSDEAHAKPTPPSS